MAEQSLKEKQSVADLEICALQCSEVSTGLFWNPQRPTIPSHMLRAVAQKGGIFLHLHEGTCYCHLSQYVSFQFWLLQCSASLTPYQQWGELGTGESCRVMYITLGVCWGHQHNLLSVDLVPWLGVVVITWELKHSAGVFKYKRSVGDSEEVDIPKITACT